MTLLANSVEWILGIILILASLGVILARNPVYACLSFLLALLTLSAIYQQLAAQFIAVMQILVYAGAILVIFMFVIILFQDAHYQISNYEPQSSPILLGFAAATFLLTLAILAKNLINLPLAKDQLPAGYGTVESLGQALYIDFFFPFEAVILLFLIAVMGALYIGKRVK